MLKRLLEILMKVPPTRRDPGPVEIPQPAKPRPPEPWEPAKIPRDPEPPTVPGK
jgi:hypothetical protein